MRRLLACDLDGTLLNENEVSKENRAAIRKLRANGNLFVVSTGRPLNGVKFLKESNNIDMDYYILLNGALILNTNMEKMIHKTISFYLIKEIVDEYKRHDVWISLENGYETYILKGENFNYEGQTHINGLHEIPDSKLSLISMCFRNCSPKDLDRICHELNHNYGKKITAFRNGIYIDIVPRGCSKGNAVEYVIDFEGINRKKAFTIGDSWNDISMFNITPNSFTFHHVEEGLRESANYVVESVAECIEQYIL